MTIRRFGGLVVTLVVLVAVTSVAAGAAGQDKLVGAGKRLNLAGQSIQLEVDAHSGANGEAAEGSYSVTRETATGPVSHQGTVYCLAVSGNRANARAIVTASTAPDVAVGSGFGIQITDNGKADTNLNFFFDPNESGCGIFSDPPEVPMAKGNFVVSDATG